MSRHNVFTFGQVYDRVIPWAKRLPVELRFLNPLLREATLLLDAACGTGRHACELAKQGKRVIGIDISPEMLHQARQLQINESVRSRTDFVLSSMSFLPLRHHVVEAILCLGSSLSLLPANEVSQTITVFANNLRSNGILGIQIRNLNAASNAIAQSSRSRFLPVQNGVLEDGTRVLFLRFYDYADHDIQGLNLVILSERNGDWIIDHQYSQLTNLQPEALSRLFTTAGFSSLEWFDGYTGITGDPAAIKDIFLVARRKP